MSRTRWKQDQVRFKRLRAALAERFDQDELMLELAIGDRRDYAGPELRDIFERIDSVGETAKRALLLSQRAIELLDRALADRK